MSVGRRRRSRAASSLASAPTAAAVVFVALLAAAGSWSWWAFRQSHIATHRIETQHLRLAAAANELRTEVAGMLQGQTSYVLYDGEGRAVFEAKLERVDTALDALTQLVDTPSQLALLAKMRSEVGAFRSVDTHIWSALQAGRADAARSLTLGPNALTATFVGKDAEVLAGQTSDERDAALARVVSRLSTDMALALGFGAGAVAGVALLGAVTIGRLRRRLRELDAAGREAITGVRSLLAGDEPDDEVTRASTVLNTLVGRWQTAQDRVDRDRTLGAGFDRVSTEAEARSMVADALRELVPGQSVELLLADELEPTVSPAVVHGNLPGGPACPVPGLGSCAAVREGRTLVFSSPNELGACPKLSGRPYGAVSAACVPVTFLGRPVGVLHVIGNESVPPDELTVDGLQAIATHAGHAIGEARADALAGLDLDLDV